MSRPTVVPRFVAGLKGLLSPTKKPADPPPPRASETNKQAPQPVPKVEIKERDPSTSSPATSNSPKQAPEPVLKVSASSHPTSNSPKPPPPPTITTTTTTTATTTATTTTTTTTTTSTTITTTTTTATTTTSALAPISTGRSRLASIPDVVHAIITSFLSVRQLFSITALGREWRDTFWSHCPRIDLSSLTHRLNDARLDQLLKRVPTVHALSVAKCRPLTNVCLKWISSLVDLEELNMEGCGNSLTDFKVLAACSKLKRLNLSGCAGVDDFAIQEISARCPNIHDLSLNGLQELRDTTLKRICELKHLSWLRLNGTHITKGLPYLYNLGKNLLGCQLGYCSALTNHVLEELLIACPNIVQLFLYGCTSLTDAALIPLAQAKRLVQLDLSMCRQITDDGIRALVGRASCLESLNIYDCVRLTDLALQSIADSCVNLKYLGAFGLPHITDLGVAYVLEHRQSLRRVEFGGCPGIKTETRRTTMLSPPVDIKSRARTLSPSNDSSVLPLLSPSIIPLTSSPWPSADPPERQPSEPS